MPALLRGRGSRLWDTAYRGIASLCDVRRHSSTQASQIAPKDTIHRDVCIVGGGASGTFSAVRLADAGKTVAVIERANRLGGHTLTYQDPASGLKTEAGVVVIRNSPVGRDYFKRFDIPLVKFDPPAPVATVYVDFATGKKVEFTPRDPSQALAAYGAQLSKYPFLDNGYNLPDPIPEDLLLPFGEFVKKYDLGPMVMLASKLCQGLGDILTQPALYVMKNFGATALDGFANGFLVPASGDNSELYAKAFTTLKEDVLLSSTIQSVQRDKASVKVLVRTPAGHKLVVAKQLLLTVPPTPDNLKNFDLDAKEQSLFEQFGYTAWWTLVLRGSGIPDGYYITNLAPGLKESLPRLPGIYEITPTGIPDHVNLKYGSPVPLPEETVKADVMAGLARLRSAGTFQTKAPEVAVLSSHTPFQLTVPVPAITGGFYEQLAKMNGHRRTFYTGATLQAHDASLIWEYTDKLLQKFF